MRLCDKPVTPAIRLCLFAAFLTLLPQVRAQITNVTNSTSTPTPGSGHDYLKFFNETVNPANGSVSIRINTPTPSGRQLSLPFAFAYDTNGSVTLKSSNGSGGFGTQNANFWSSGGWSYALPILTATTMEKLQQLPNGNTTECQIHFGYAFQDPSGGRHALDMADALNNSGTGPGCHNESAASGGDDFVNAAFACPTAGTSCPPVRVTTEDGTVFFFDSAFDEGSGCFGCVGSSLPKYVEDRNGNRINVVDNGKGAFTVTDTAGRTAISSSGFGTTGNTVTISGLATPYTVSWGTTSGTGASIGPQPLSGNALDGECVGFNDVWPSNLPTITSIQLPNGQQYKFSYGSNPNSTYSNPYGLISEIDYPTGGWIKYQWALNAQSEVGTFPDQSGNPSACGYKYGWPAVSHRYVSFDGTTIALQQDFTYSTTWNGPVWTNKQTTVTTHDLVRGTSFQTVYSYTSVNAPGCIYCSDAFATQIPVESTVTYKDLSGTVLKTSTKTWEDQYRMDCESTTLPTGQISRTDRVYQVGLVESDKKEWDWGQAPACGTATSGTPRRETVTTFQSFANTPIYPNAASISDLPSSVVTYDNGTRAAETDYSYDQTTVASVSNLPTGSHDETNYAPASTAPRGNATTVTKQCFQGTTACAANPATKYAFDETGQIVSATDPNGNVTQYSYTDNFLSGSGTPPGSTNAYLTTVTHPTVNGVTLHQYFQYAYSDGQLTQSQDDNDKAAGIATTYTYNDDLRRLTETDLPDGGKTTISYNDTAPTPSVTKSILMDNGTPNLVETSTTILDGMGHATETQLTSDPEGTDYTTVAYDGLGRVMTSYNPTRCNPPTTNCGNETTWGFSTHNYDALGRVTSVTEQDGSATSTSYSGNCTTVSDEAGNERQSCTDGLGRLTKVVEAPNVSAFNFETDYQYNALGELLCAVQKAADTTPLTSCSAAPTTWRPRSFVYDSLSRLTSASNPESGTITYAYDADGNVATKTAPSPNQTGTATVVTTYTYDALDRLTKKSYNDGKTATVVYGYDGVAPTGCTPPTLASLTTFGISASPANQIGRRSSMCDASGATTWGYDQVGSTKLETRTLNGATETLGYLYYLNHQPFRIIYQSGHGVFQWRTAADRQHGVGDETNNYVFPNSTYTPNGAVSSEGRGSGGGFSGILIPHVFNNRLQPVLEYATVSGSGQHLYQRCYDFHVNGGLSVTFGGITCTFPSPTTGDNGDFYQIVNKLDDNRTQNFSYDALNRISQASTNGPNWGEAYTIDPWGNLTNRAGVTGKNTFEPLNASATVQNRLTGFGYDSAGNMASNGSATYTYDAENRLIAAGGMSYIYDGDGARVEKCTEGATAGSCSSSATGTLYWHNMAGQVVDESDLSGNINEEYMYFNGVLAARVDRPSGTIHYYIPDHLGSTQIVATPNSSNTVTVAESDFYPYGGEIPISGSDPNHYKFTGKERDSESGLDNFGARYDSSSLGRFMTPDWAAKPVTVPYATFGDPQSLNLYAYVENAPVNRVDADGHNNETCDSSSSGQCDPRFTSKKGGEQERVDDTVKKPAQNTTQLQPTQNQPKPGEEHKGEPTSLQPTGSTPAANGARTFTYQVVDPTGRPVRDVSVQEHVKVVASENVEIVPNPNPVHYPAGVVSDRIGPLAPPTQNSFLKTEQTFTATKGGNSYEMTTKVNQYVRVSNGNVTVQTVVIVP